MELKENVVPVKLKEKGPLGVKADARNDSIDKFDFGRSMRNAF
jgi:hypothetical protein